MSRLKETQLRYLAECRDDLREPLNAAERAERVGEVPYWGANSVQGYVNEAKLDFPVVLLGEDGAPFFDRAREVAFYKDKPLWPNNHIHVLVPRDGVNGRWLAYALNAVDYSRVINGSTREKLTQGAMMSIKLPESCPDHQRAIADFLDRETQRIDELIAEQRGLIETLRERRGAVIGGAVTRGIDAAETAGMSVPWIGALPSHWQSGKVKHLGEVTLGKMLQSIGREGEIEAPYMRAANVQPDGVLLRNTYKTMWFKEAELKSLSLCRGDVVVVEGGVGGYGRAAYVSDDLVGWGFQNSINRIRPYGDGRYLAYFLQMARSKGFIEAYCNIVSMPHLTAEKLEAMPAPVPPIYEQRRIANHLDEQTSHIDALIAESEDLIALSLERRSALITAAVTGQIHIDEDGRQVRATEAD